MKSNIIFLLGEAGSGKDTIGREFVKLGYTRISFADAMKQQFADNNNIDVKVLHIQGDEKEFWRPKLIEFAEEERKKNPLIWLETAFNPYMTNGVFNENINLVITDFRRIDEVYWYYNLWKTIKEFESKAVFPDIIKHPVNLKMFHVCKPDSNDKDVLTHLAIGVVKGIKYIYPEFCNAVISLPEGKGFTREEYEAFQEIAKEKVKILKILFDL